MKLRTLRIGDAMKSAAQRKSVPNELKRGFRWNGKRWCRLYSHGPCDVCGTEIISELSPMYRLQQFCSRTCKSTTQKGKPSPNWRGGRKLARQYWKLYKPLHPNAEASGYVAEHRYVAAELCGCPLAPEDVVHHINGDPQDNRPENLEVVSRAEHMKLHLTGRVVGPETRAKLSASANIAYRDPQTGRFVPKTSDKETRCPPTITKLS